MMNIQAHHSNPDGLLRADLSDQIKIVAFLLEGTMFYNTVEATFPALSMNLEETDLERCLPEG